MLMLLSTRLTLVFGGVAAALLTALALAAAGWQAGQEERLAQVLLDIQRIGWRKIETAELERLQRLAETLAEQLELSGALTADGLAARARMLRRGGGGAQLDVVGADAQLLYSSSSASVGEAQLDGPALHRVLAGQVVNGLTPVAGEHFALVVAVPIRQAGGVAAALTLGVPVGAVLDELAGSLGAEVVLFNLRGRAMDGGGQPAYVRLAPAVALRHDGVIELEDHSGRHQVTSTTVAGLDGRQVAGLAVLRDVSAQRARERWRLGVTAGATLLFTAAVLVWLFFHVRRRFAPLARAVEVLTALSRGDTSVGLEVGPLDEAGRIALGVARLREEMIKLDLLREERSREARRQERIIRAELRQLEETLDPAGRAPVPAGWVVLPPSRPDADAGDQLALLASVLQGLSGRIRAQQANLLQLVQDLNVALRTREAFVSLQQELVIARRMQLSILPRQLPERADVALASLILPAKEVGGDFYDYFLLDGRRLAVVIADVAGKGVPAAFYMAVSRTLLKVSAGFVPSPAETLARVNNLLAAENEEMMFVTLFYGVLDLDTGRFDYASGGHNPPALRRGGVSSLLSQPGGMALAVQTDCVYGEGRLQLLAGDVLFLYTDGITEASNDELELFGDAALLAALDALPADAPAAHYPPQVEKVLAAFVGTAPQADDITCMALRYAGPHTIIDNINCD
ncbi:SpoIIE family protein phosphatase [Rugamonas aquatica]|uniref:SpoIIE family protein phosphatase n=1 Tax=Rugamonas aquatica TaxID=2743357 RepID=A0A6A7N6Z7_9BURK|nr:SpoIIE family protein phosphatase [Rugamonas aquatica]MQA40779.1 SpoIIE family protein phosphatase [Rugamonas aquatica]